MAKKVKMEPDVGPSSAAEKAPQGAPPTTPKFDRMCDGLKDRGIVFDSEDPRVDRFTHVKCEIAKYTGK